MTLLQSGIHEILSDNRISRHDSRSERFHLNDPLQYLPAFSVQVIDQSLALMLENVEKVEPKRYLLDHVIDPVNPAKSSHQILKWDRFPSLPKSHNFSLHQKLFRIYLSLRELNNLGNTLCNVS